MKIILLTLVIALLSNSSYCQKKGCGEIQLGATLSSVKALNHYKLNLDLSSAVSGPPGPGRLSLLKPGQNFL